jgi:hypothetical protein
LTHPSKVNNASNSYSLAGAASLTPELSLIFIFVLSLLQYRRLFTFGGCGGSRTRVWK